MECHEGFDRCLHIISDIWEVGVSMMKFLQNPDSLYLSSVSKLFQECILDMWFNVKIALHLKL